MTTHSHKLKAIPLVAVMACGVGVAAVLYLVAFPNFITATSPDGRFTARVTYPNLWGQLMLPRDSRDANLIRIRLVDNATGKQIQVDQAGAAGLLGGGETPDEVLWKADSKSFVYLYIAEVNAGDGRAYDVVEKPFAARRAKAPLWVKPMLLRRLDTGRADDCEKVLFNKLDNSNYLR